MRRLDAEVYFALLCFAIIYNVCHAELFRRSMSDECNNYVDGVLTDLKNDKEYFEDPYKLEDKSIAFHKKLLLVNYTGEATINDGFIYGLATLHRESDVVVDKSKRTHLKVYLGAGEIKLICSGKLKLMNFGPTVKVNAIVSYLAMKLDIVPNQKTGENPKVVGFNIEDAKGTKLKISGLGPLGFFAKPYAKILATVFKGFIRKGIESRIQKFMANKLNKYVIPMECLNVSVI